MTSRVKVAGMNKNHLGQNVAKKNHLGPYPGSVIRFFSDGAHFLNASRENPPLIIPGVAKSTQGPGLLMNERSKWQTEM